ncbi:MAG: hypothetical protein WC623_24450 [Pedobacter sp.]|uniref:hypothetical protein n=1 Tax=Pedobacter sp. TaxID=1411316 RepID=UPI003562C7D3
MANLIITKNIAVASADFTLASLGAGSAVQAARILNPNGYPAAKITVKLTQGATVVAGQLYEIYIARGNGTVRDDNAADAKGTIVVTNSTQLGTIVTTATINEAKPQSFDTAIIGVLGADWVPIIKNASANALNATEANHSVTYEYYIPEIQ